MEITSNLHRTTERAEHNFLLACERFSNDSSGLRKHWVQYHFRNYIQTMIINNDGLYKDLLQEKAYWMEWLKSGNPVKIYMAAYNLIDALQYETLRMGFSTYRDELEFIVAYNDTSIMALFIYFQYDWDYLKNRARDMLERSMIVCQECGRKFESQYEFDCHIGVIPGDLYNPPEEICIEEPNYDENDDIPY